MEILKKTIKVVLWSVAILVAVILALVLIINGMLPGREKKLNEAWAKTLIPLDDFPRQFPRVENNASALAVEKLSAALGIALEPGSSDIKRAKPTDEAEKSFAAIKGSGDKAMGLSEYVDAQLEKGAGEIDAAPEPLQLYLTVHAAELAALRDQLLKNDPPRWGYDISKGISMEIPNLLGQMNLNRLLMADALAALRDGREAQALENLDASWRLHEEMGKQPVLVCRLISLAVERMELGVARRLTSAPAGWEERLQTYDPHRAMAIAFEFEAWGWRQLGTSDFKAIYGASKERSASARIPIAIQRSYLRLSITETSEVMRKRVEKYLTFDPCQVAQFKQSDTELMANLSWWNYLGKIAIPNLSSAWLRAARAALEAEMTRKLLEIKRLRGSDGAWPQTVPGISDSVCKGEMWEYRVEPDGGMFLAFSQPIDWEKLNLKGAKIPLMHTEKAPTRLKDGAGR